MAKMIDVEELWLAVRDDPNITGKQFVAIKEHILGAKTVDAVEVVRCKDCENCEPHRLKSGQVYFRRCGFYDIEVAANDFCANGERKAEDGK